MADTTSVRLTDTTGTPECTLTLPHDTPMERLIPALLTVLNRPVIGTDGQPISYRLYFNNREIGQNETLQQAGVREDDTVSLSQEATAGAERGRRRWST